MNLLCIRKFNEFEESQFDTTNGVFTRFDNYDYGLPGSGILIWHINELKIYNQISSYGINADINEKWPVNNNSFDLAITRAGASTLAELAHLNIPFIAIPFPHATDNHQFWNAKRYFDPNCCWILEEKNFMPGDIYLSLIHI